MNTPTSERAELRSKYFAEQYRRQKDIRKMQYYEKKLRDLENNKIYEKYGNERTYYENYYKKLSNNQ